jgi:hypothetical protein
MAMPKKKVVGIINIKKYLSDPNNINGLNNSIVLLRLIDELYKQGKYPTSTNLVNEYFEDGYKEAYYYGEEEYFIRGKRSTISRMLRPLKKEGQSLIEVYKPKKRIDGKPLRPTLLGREVLAFPNIDLIIQGKIPLIISDDNNKMNKHSEEILKLINKIINELESLKSLQLLIVENKIIPDTSVLSKPKFMNEILYPDLKYHLIENITFDELVTKYDKYENIFHESRINKTRMVESIKKIINEDMKMEWAAQTSKTNHFNNNLIDHIINVMDKFIKNNKESIEKYCNERGKLIVFTINNVEVCRIYRKHSNEKDNKKICQNLNDMMISIDKQPYYNMYKEYCSNREEMDRLIEEMILGLKKVKEMKIYPGPCDYIK